MSSSLSPLDAWLSGETAGSDPGQLFWDPGFDAERRVVISKLGPYRKLFERPQNFFPRFFHRVYSLPIEDWVMTIKTRLYGGFCTLTTELQIHFQPTLKYIERNLDTLPEVNRQIKSSYESVIKDIVNAELSHLKDGVWVHTGLTDMERQIENVINETLILKHIQCRSVCQLTPAFAELTDDEKLDGRFTQEAVYLNVMQKNFEFREKQTLELFRQEEELEVLRLEHQQKQLETINQEDAIQRQKQALEAEAVKRQLEEQEAQRIEQHAIEMRLQEQKTRHEMHLKEIELAAEIQYQKEKQIRQQQLDLQKQAQQLEHERMLKELKRDAEMRDYEKERLQWLQGKEQEQRLKQMELEAELKEQEIHQLERQKIQERMEAEKLEHQQRLHQMQLEAEIKELELRAESTKSKDEYLRREIEWLVLDKQRAELTRSIREASQGDDDRR
ncbi:MAG: hypothetical protein PHI13_05070 [Methylococcales bacterium]|nr:hypothetical protein [Methylococcales bacterium]